MAELNSKQPHPTPQPKTIIPPLPKSVFKIKVNSQAIFDSIMSERASRRQGTHKVKTRAEVRGTGRKPYAQKGTGNSRQGSKRSPQWVGGGVVGGPTPNRNYLLKVNKKVKQLAFRSALTLKAKNKAVLVYDFQASKKPNTKAFLKQLQELKIKQQFKKILVVTSNPLVKKSAANLPKIHVNNFSSLLVEEIVNADFIIFSSESIKHLGGK